MVDDREHATPRGVGFRFALFLVSFLPVSAIAQTTHPAWVDRSNANAQLLIDVNVKFDPEDAAADGVKGIDDQIVDLTPGYERRRADATAAAVAELRRRLTIETDPDVRLDLQLLITSAERELRSREVRDRRELPYVGVARMLFSMTQSLLDDQVEPQRRPGAVVRLRKYAGLEPGYEPLMKLVTDRLRERMQDPARLGPVKARLENDLAHDATALDGIGQLCERYKLADYEKPLAALKDQLATYHKFLETDVLPRARDDFRLPPDLYALRLQEVGVDMPADELVRRAEATFHEIQNEMNALAPLVAREEHLSVGSTDYRAVLRELKERQIPPGTVTDFYETRIKAVEDIIRQEHVVTLPQRPMRFHIASSAETVVAPAPHYQPPRLLNNTGQQGEFVLPLDIAGSPGGKALAMDDFTYDAFAWTLTAHEGRPGHDLQFAAVTEKGVSLARAMFAFNSVNVEGWALYAEAEMKPYWPLDGQLAALQARLMRAARAILDPGLQAGTISRDEATRVLRDDVCLSEGTALQEIQRYTFVSPAQATAYFCGYERLMELRAETERLLGPKFDRQRYHDFLLGQGLLPPTLLRQAVLSDFVPEEKR